MAEKKDKPKRILRLCAKCSDACGLILEVDGVITGEHNDYVPAIISDDSDYVELEIDIDTGKIVGWKTPTKAQLKKLGLI